METMKFVKIPGTSLEIGSSGHGRDRLIIFRTKTASKEVTAVYGHCLIIGNARSELAKAMQEKVITRRALDALLDQPISGNSYSQIYNAVLSTT